MHIAGAGINTAAYNVTERPMGVVMCQGETLPANHRHASVAVLPSTRTASV